jgi:hypothetical protein
VYGRKQKGFHFAADRLSGSAPKLSPHGEQKVLPKNF